jgi:hypothetical protein
MSFVRLLVLLRFLAGLGSCFFECGGKHTVTPFVILVLFYPMNLVLIIIELATDPARLGRESSPVALLVVPVVLYVLARPVCDAVGHTGWRRQVGPLAVGLAYAVYLAAFVWRGCWEARYLPYVLVPVGTFLATQGLILLFDGRRRTRRVARS